MNPPNTYKVRCCRIGYWGQEVSCDEYFYRWYWMADLRSWVMHNVFGRSCNTFVHDAMRDKVNPRPVVFK